MGNFTPRSALNDWHDYRALKAAPRAPVHIPRFEDVFAEVLNEWKATPGPLELV